jgi:hypothetical protein
MMNFKILLVTKVVGEGTMSSKTNIVEFENRANAEAAFTEAVKHCNDHRHEGITVRAYPLFK